MHLKLSTNFFGPLNAVFGGVKITVNPKQENVHFLSLISPITALGGVEIAVQNLQGFAHPLKSRWAMRQLKNLSIPR